MSSLRLFMAVPCQATPGLRRVLAALAEHREVFKPVAAEQVHVTLRFLGEQPAERVGELAAAMQRAVSGAGVSAVSLGFRPLAVLPPGERRPPRTVCVELADAEPLHALHAALTRELARLDPPVPEPDRPFRAHLTLARVKARAGRRKRDAAFVRDFVARHATTDLGRFACDAVHLIASELTPQGPIHRTQHTATLPLA